MSHKYDVIYLLINEGIQKTKNKDHSKLVIPNWSFQIGHSVSMKFLIVLNENAFNGGFDFYTELSEGQEFDRRSKMQYKDHFRSPNPNSSFDGSYHSTLRF